MGKLKFFLVITAMATFISSVAVQALPFVEIVPESDYADEVVIAEGSQLLIINGKEHIMPAEVYYSEKSGALMVPVRYICLAVGLPENAVKWDAAQSAITIDAGKRLVWMQIGKTHYYVNRVLMPILNDSGNLAIVEVVDGRAFVPYSTMGEALHITFELTEDGKGARYNFPTQM